MNDGRATSAYAAGTLLSLTACLVALGKASWVWPQGESYLWLAISATACGAYFFCADRAFYPIFLRLFVVVRPSCAASSSEHPPSEREPDQHPCS